ncbi:hypothetical protein [Dyella silvatica]|uniref:hypothetical protein n=1 Tax=Dyella silvatica TaxID=2992128 RepID=UPI002251B94F|nr:hypothetical protein [Dyella silvatica]
MHISRKLNLALWIVSLCLCSVFAQASDQALADKPVVKDKTEVTGYGFNWHADPDTVRCIKMTPVFVASFKACVHLAKDDSQTGTMKFQCDAGGDKSYLIAETLKQCQDAKDTMAANAP